MIPGRVLLVLGRVSNLSTVWSNCLCAWTIAGGGPWTVFASLLLGLSLLYVGGMYLNDYCDLEFDLKFRPERPIPAGRIEGKTVLLLTLVLLGGGLGAVAWINLPTAGFGLLLLGLIVAYNVVHKKTAWGVPLMAACRTGIYVVVGAAAEGGLSAEIFWAGGLMFVYVAGITGIARTESTRNTFPIWALASLALPLAGGLYLSGSGGDAVFYGCLLLVIVWIARSLMRAKAGSKWIVGKSIGSLLAGICLIDLMILSSLSLFSLIIGVSLMAFFIIALFAQRSIPAT